eukprot:TRINITY_DN99374_c0_g1_i2.p1 TRINITY_DN99374_c0_g1~~TRINITY_DN99374_c0_g1_i2.p1  ORF type:complete len:111 (+),score=0.45 TRINITY_DN99374_c0_g1_i2:3-335(+)
MRCPCPPCCCVSFVLVLLFLLFVAWACNPSILKSFPIFIPVPISRHLACAHAPPQSLSLLLCCCFCLPSLCCFGLLGVFVGLGCCRCPLLPLCGCSVLAASANRDSDKFH